MSRDYCLDPLEISLGLRRPEHSPLVIPRHGRIIIVVRRRPGWWRVIYARMDLIPAITERDLEFFFG